MICFWKPDTKGRLNLMTFEEKIKRRTEPDTVIENVGIFGYWETTR